MRGQGSLEYFIILAAVFVVIGGVTVHQMVDPGTEVANDAEKLAHARSTCDTIANAINGVYANSEGAWTTEFIHFPFFWKLENQSDNLRVGVETDEGWKWLESGLKYELNVSRRSFSSGSYKVIVGWPATENEGIQVHGDNIYIYINPGGGS